MNKEYETHPPEGEYLISTEPSKVNWEAVSALIKMWQRQDEEVRKAKYETKNSNNP